MLALCEGQEDHRCAERCYVDPVRKATESYTADILYWTQWVQRRMAQVREIARRIDLFIAPSRFLLTRMRDEFGIPEAKLVYLDNAFHYQHLAGRRRAPEETIVFGYIGTHMPAKGIQQLIEAFALSSDEARLRIWGRHLEEHTDRLKAQVATLPESIQSRIEWMGEYRNQDIINSVFNRCDVIVVPSLWAENSPLVIHEALQARLPVITANYGGMAEYIHHEVNGLLFAHRDPSSLATQMQRLVDDPAYAQRLGRRGYLQATDGNVPSFEQHTQIMEQIYADLVARKSQERPD